MNTSTDARPTIETLGADLGRRIESQLDTIFRTFMRGPEVTRTAEYFRIVTGEPHPLANFALMKQATTLEAMRTAAEPLLSCNAPAAIIFPGGVDEPIEQYITSLNFTPAEVMQAMAVDLDQLSPVELPAGYTLAEVDASDDDRWCEALAAGFEIPRSIANMLGPRAASETSEAHRFRFFCIQRDGVIVATSFLFEEDGIIGVYAVSTVPTERGKGLGAYITAEPLRKVRSEGYRTGILQSSEMGEPVYRRLGFREFGHLRLFVRMPDAG